MSSIAVSGSADVAPPDFSTVTGKIRALIPDVEQVDYADTGVVEYMFSDRHLTGLYEITFGTDIGRICRAAASAIRALAVSEGLIQKVIRTEDLQTDGAKLASALLAAAKQLEDRADAADEDDEILMVVDFQPLPQDNLPYSLRGFPAGWAGTGTGFGRWL